MDKLSWFKFSPSDWVMGRIQKCSFEAQAEFLRLCCIYWNKECLLSVEDVKLEITEVAFDELVKKQIIKVHDEVIEINFLDAQMGKLCDLSEVRRKAANARWSKCNANAMQMHNFAMPKEKIRKDKKREDKIENNCMLKNSQFSTLDTFMKAMETYANGKYLVYDLEHYYYEMLNWSNAKGEKRKDWLATCGTFIGRDKQPKLKQTKKTFSSFE